MSKNISVKINNGNKTIETVKLNAANQKVIIKAQPHVNYELVDEATQYAPEMIDTKRVGNVFILPLKAPISIKKAI